MAPVSLAGAAFAVTVVTAVAAFIGLVAVADAHDRALSDRLARSSVA